MLAEDGSGKGAGLVSAIAKRIKYRSYTNEAPMNGNGVKNGNTNGHH